MKKNLKYIIAAFMSAALIFTAASCKNDTDDDETPVSNTPASTTQTTTNSTNNSNSSSNSNASNTANSSENANNSNNANNNANSSGNNNTENADTEAKATFSLLSMTDLVGKTITTQGTNCKYKINANGTVSVLSFHGNETPSDYQGELSDFTGEEEELKRIAIVNGKYYIHNGYIKFTSGSGYYGTHTIEGEEDEGTMTATMTQDAMTVTFGDDEEETFTFVGKDNNGIFKYSYVNGDGEEWEQGYAYDGEGLLSLQEEITVE